MRAAFVALFPLLFASAAIADELVPLEQVLQGEPDESYMFVRCAGFHTANLEWAGLAIEETQFEEIRDLIGALLVAATLTRAARNEGDLTQFGRAVNADTRMVADLYLIDYRRSYAVRGAAWDGNPLWMGDAETCRPIGDAATVFVDEQRVGQ